MSSLHRIALLALALLFACNVGQAQQTRSNPALKLRVPRSLTQLVDDAKPVDLEDGRKAGKNTDDEGVLEELKGFFSDDGEADSAPNDALEMRMKRAEIKDSDAEESSDEENAEEEEDDEEQASRIDPMVFAALPSIRTVSLNMPVSQGILPTNHAAEAFATRSMDYQTMGYQRPTHAKNAQWTAPWVSYRPLYFEDVWLERHGYDYGHLQPFVSAAKFYGRIPFLPYMKGATPCKECVFSYGLGRPGDCTPHFFTLPKRSKRGALYQTAFIAGTALLTP